MVERTPEAPRGTAEHDLGLPCPSCHGRMQVQAIGCGVCELRVEGRFKGNEFADLPPDQLQLLRVFVLCEGSIRDMEKALGVSYPTVKNRIAALRAQLGLQDDASFAVPASVATASAVAPSPDAAAALAVLDALERGELDAAGAAAALRGAQSTRGG